MVCSRGGRHLFWFRGGCATAASCRCLAGRSDRRRPPLCPWDRGDGGRPQRVSGEARPARPSHNFRAPARRDIGARRAFGQESMPQRDRAGDGNCCAPLRLTIRSRAAVGGCECSQAILLASYATTWPPAELSVREPLAQEHRWRSPAPHTVFGWGKGHLPSISQQARSERWSWTRSRFVLKRIPCVFERLDCAAQGEKRRP